MGTKDVRGREFWYTYSFYQFKWKFIQFIQGWIQINTVNLYIVIIAYYSWNSNDYYE